MDHEPMNLEYSPPRFSLINSPPNAARQFGPGLEAQMQYEGAVRSKSVFRLPDCSAVQPEGAN